MRCNLYPESVVLISTMKKTYSLSSACFLFFISMSSFAQSNGNTSEVQPSSNIQPISTTNTTDPNYEANLARYKDYKPFVAVAGVVKKDEAYYQHMIADLKADITVKENMEAKSAEVLMKIELLKTELELLEKNYKELIVK